MCWKKSSSMIVFLLVFSNLYKEVTSDRCSVCTTQEVSQGYYNCSSCGLQRIPKFPSKAIIINLTKNNISEVGNWSFKHTPTLQGLDLSNNTISRIHKDAFRGLRVLSSLSLHKKMVTDKCLHSLIYLKNVTYLDISKNVYTTFPASLLHMFNLETLKIDLFSGFKFDDRFVLLRRLSDISFSSHGYFNIHNDSFRSLSSAPIKNLTLSAHNAVLGHIGLNFLEPFRFLERLVVKIGGNHDIKDIMKMLYGLRNRKLDTLMLDSNKWDVIRFHFLTAKDIHNLLTMCVKEVSLNNNHIVHFPFDSALGTNFSRCLEKISITGNLMLWTVSSQFSLTSFPSIRHINVSVLPYKVKARMHSHMNAERKLITLPPTLSLTVYCPPLLESLDVSGYNLSHAVITNRKVINMKDVLQFKCPHLKTLKASQTEFKLCSLQTRFDTSLTYLDISGWNCSNLNPNFLSDFKYLKKMYAASSYLGLGLQRNNSQKFLSNLHNLEVLDLNGNSIASLHVEFFRSQRYSLKMLYLKQNSFINVPTALNSLFSIDFIDLSDNSIASFNVDDRMIINNLKSAKFDFSGNRFECSCRFKTSIVWMSERKHFFNHSYCTDGKKVSLILENIESFQIKCLSEFWLDFAVVSLFTLTFSILVVAAGYRNKSLVIYFYLKARRFLQYQEVHSVQCYRYDIFVSYSEDDMSWVTENLCQYLNKILGLGVCFHHKDFIPGKSIAEEILRCIDESRKSAFVITENFLNSEWCLFEMEIARQHVFHHESDTLIIILKDEIPIHKMPNVLRKIWWRVVCLKYPQNENEMEHEMFWRKLQEAVR